MWAPGETAKARVGVTAYTRTGLGAQGTHPISLIGPIGPIRGTTQRWEILPRVIRLARSPNCELLFACRSLPFPLLVYGC